jgi:hypothetical protein
MRDISTAIDPVPQKPSRNEAGAPADRWMTLQIH